MNAVFGFFICLGESLGYRAMCRRLQRKGFVVARNAVMLAMRILRPYDVNQRRKRRLHRRAYIAPGPSFAWHIDGYDKLKKFGFAIHAA